MDMFRIKWCSSEPSNVVAYFFGPFCMCFTLCGNGSLFKWSYLIASIILAWSCLSVEPVAWGLQHWSWFTLLLDARAMLSKHWWRMGKGFMWICFIEHIYYCRYCWIWYDLFVVFVLCDQHFWLMFLRFLYIWLDTYQSSYLILVNNFT